MFFVFFQLKYNPKKQKFVNNECLKWKKKIMGQKYNSIKCQRLSYQPVVVMDKLDDYFWHRVSNKRLSSINLVKFQYFCPYFFTYKEKTKYFSLIKYFFFDFIFLFQKYKEIRSDSDSETSDTESDVSSFELIS